MLKIYAKVRGEFLIEIGDYNDLISDTVTIRDNKNRKLSTGEIELMYYEDEEGYEVEEDGTLSI